MKIPRTISGTLLMLSILIGYTATATANDDIRTIEIVGMDNLRFDVEEIQAQPGEEIRIRFKVESAMPANAMSHNVAVVEPDIAMDTFIPESESSPNNEYIAPGFEDQVIVATDMIGGGETDEITFTVPEEPGEYPYVCTFPGHYAGGMTGVLIVGEEDL